MCLPNHIQINTKYDHIVSFENVVRQKKKKKKKKLNRVNNHTTVISYLFHSCHYILDFISMFLLFLFVSVVFIFIFCLTFLCLRQCKSASVCFLYIMYLNRQNSVFSFSFCIFSIIIIIDRLWHDWLLNCCWQDLPHNRNAKYKVKTMKNHCNAI